MVCSVSVGVGIHSGYASSAWSSRSPNAQNLRITSVMIVAPTLIDAMTPKAKPTTDDIWYVLYDGGASRRIYTLYITVLMRTFVLDRTDRAFMIHFVPSMPDQFCPTQMSVVVEQPINA